MFLHLASLLCLTPFFFHQMVVSGDECMTAIINITYVNQLTGFKVVEITEAGVYGDGPVRTEKGTVVAIKSNKGCNAKYEETIPEKDKWIALIERGDCYFFEKISNAAKHNSSAVVIYNNEPGLTLINMQYADQSEETENMVGVFVDNDYGRKIVEILDNGTAVHMEIAPGLSCETKRPINSLSVLFVSVSFITLMVVSLAWLVFYYIQRFRYTHIRSKAQKRLGQATKKAIHKISQRTVKTGDRELDEDFDNCAICIESYNMGDCIRVLPCKHVFHKNCVDEWLLLHQTCPICKLNIVKAVGGNEVGEEENDDVNNSNVVEITSAQDVEAAATTTTTSPHPSAASAPDGDSPPTTTAPLQPQIADTVTITVHPSGRSPQPPHHSFQGSFDNLLYQLDGSTASVHPECHNDSLPSTEDGEPSKKSNKDPVVLNTNSDNNDNSVV